MLQKISLLKEKKLHIFSDFGLKSSKRKLFPFLFTRLTLETYFTNS